MRYSLIEHVGNPVRCGVFSGDGQLFISGGNGSLIHIYDMYSYDILMSLNFTLIFGLGMDFSGKLVLPVKLHGSFPLLYSKKINWPSAIWIKL
jgi:WD40 repeat protein